MVNSNNTRQEGSVIQWFTLIFREACQGWRFLKAHLFACFYRSNFTSTTHVHCLRGSHGTQQQQQHQHLSPLLDWPRPAGSSGCLSAQPKGK